MRGLKGLQKAWDSREHRRALAARSAIRPFNLFHHTDSRALLEPTKPFRVKAATVPPAIGFVAIPARIGAITPASEPACVTFAIFTCAQMHAWLATKISLRSYRKQVTLICFSSLTVSQSPSRNTGETRNHGAEFVNGLLDR